MLTLCASGNPSQVLHSQTQLQDVTDQSPASCVPLKCTLWEFTPLLFTPLAILRLGRFSYHISIVIWVYYELLKLCFIMLVLENLSTFFRKSCVTLFFFFGSNNTHFPSSAPFSALQKIRFFFFFRYYVWETRLLVTG